MACVQLKIDILEEVEANKERKPTNQEVTWFRHLSVMQAFNSRDRSNALTPSRVTQRLYLFSLHHFEHLSKLWIFTCPDNYTLKRGKKKKKEKQMKNLLDKILWLTSGKRLGVRGLTFPFPYRTRVPMKTTLLRVVMSPASSNTPSVLLQGSASPVKLDSSTSRSVT